MARFAELPAPSLGSGRAVRLLGRWRGDGGGERNAWLGTRREEGRANALLGDAIGKTS